MLSLFGVLKPMMSPGRDGSNNKTKSGQSIESIIFQFLAATHPGLWKLKGVDARPPNNEKVKRFCTSMTWIVQ